MSLGKRIEELEQAKKEKRNALFEKMVDELTAEERRKLEQILERDLDGKKLSAEEKRRAGNIFGKAFAVLSSEERRFLAFL
jgi:hypothetical protein